MKQSRCIHVVDGVRSDKKGSADKNFLAEKDQEESIEIWCT